MVVIDKAFAAFLVAGAILFALLVALLVTFLLALWGVIQLPPYLFH